LSSSCRAPFAADRRQWPSANRSKPDIAFLLERRPSRYQTPTLGIEAQGSAGGKAALAETHRYFANLAHWLAERPV